MWGASVILSVIPSVDKVQFLSFLWAKWVETWVDGGGVPISATRWRSWRAKKYWLGRDFIGCYWASFGQSSLLRTTNWTSFLLLIPTNTRWRLRLRREWASAASDWWEAKFNFLIVLSNTAGYIGNVGHGGNERAKQAICGRTNSTFNQRRVLSSSCL